MGYLEMSGCHDPYSYSDYKKWEEDLKSVENGLSEDLQNQQLEIAALKERIEELEKSTLGNEELAIRDLLKGYRKGLRECLSRITELEDRLK
jgi:hypothetical protein